MNTPTTPSCPHCNSASTKKAGSVRGKARLKCNDCLKTFAKNPGKPGRKLKGKVKKTPAQLSKEYYWRLTPEGRKALNRRKEDGRKKKKE